MFQPVCVCRCPCHDAKPIVLEPIPTLPKTPDIDLTKWKLTLPTGPKESPTEILNPALETYEDVNFDKGGPMDPFTGIRFIAPVGGVTTKNSGYPRCELREMEGEQRASWTIETGKVHSMMWQGYVEETPIMKPQVVIGQIHDADDDLVMVRFTGGTSATLDVMYMGSTRVQIPWKLGQPYQLKISCSGWKITVSLAGKMVFEASTTRKGCYFKVGAYTQSSLAKGDKPAARSVVVLEKVIIGHQQI